MDGHKPESCPDTDPRRTNQGPRDLQALACWTRQTKMTASMVQGHLEPPCRTGFLVVVQSPSGNCNFRQGDKRHAWGERGTPITSCGWQDLKDLPLAPPVQAGRQAERPGGDGWCEIAAGHRNEAMLPSGQSWVSVKSGVSTTNMTSSGSHKAVNLMQLFTSWLLVWELCA
ncbi:hypothetical protein BDN67DRAFT_168575 [Paxillus ammoniavirescens]|nr:hypothetical protein BDN67DRAFT_168575 [Paxillus ammoniavirescens]